ncbi:NAD(P) transhydrogenase subunit alpha [Marinigracilibium pacificum]|uniref:proton-translocating NAD(P)(+) transhydrogenase n=1 Tax=Marinigracilibium pacificum TaxID=2729599 RepID=A0A848J5J3_9BACT|nr:NAD(P) transhydrogenase subunit alpha [Marinigracilibium pacificum]NMM50518.1 NAD(P) transhydrogenase subunit alpha [Marinigracilibium pacificum]
MDAIISWIGENILFIYLLIFAIYLGTEIIGKVPVVLHTPLMSGANAISGVVVIGGIILVRLTPSDDYFGLFIGFLGIAFATINVAGGFAVTQRMLSMFNKKKKS